ncbi:hypothetical protein FF098_013460 [Parvularcula flava]|nr:hypothetical protein [Aquisalinus luteolus]NHK28924.1 hypothetical protein [Aquisalinus luteolus]
METHGQDQPTRGTTGRGQQSRRDTRRLRDWLADRLGLPALLATGPAPIYTKADEDPDLIARLEKLDRSIAVDELSFAPDLRYQCAAEPLAIRLIREHEGIAPGCPAVLCPGDAHAVSRLIDIAANCGLSVAFGRNRPTGDNVLPLSFHRMKSVMLSDDTPGLVSFGRGASWQDIRDAIDAAKNADSCIPRGIDTLFATPADAAAEGVFSPRAAESVAGEACTWEMILPARGTTLLDGTWVFRSQEKAEEALAAVCRKVPPFQARLIGEPDLRIGEKIGLWRLPRRLTGGNDYTGLRIAYLGDGISVRAQRFASTWPVEGLGGTFWRNGALLDDAERIGLLLDNGLTEVTVPDDGKAAERLTHALKAASNGDESGISALISRKALLDQGRIRNDVSAIVPRDFNDPLGQWQKLASIAVSPDDNAPVEREDEKPGDQTEQMQMPQQPYDSSGDTTTTISESAEWQAIRAALLPQGEAAPPPPDLEDRTPARMPAQSSAQSPASHG